jgi:hypothetical protein
MKASELKIERVAFGVQYSTHNTLLDHLGEILDEILALPEYGPEVFPGTAVLAQGRVLLNRETREQLTLTTNDTVLDLPINDLDIEKVKDLGAAFADKIWKTVWELGKHPPATRFGCMLSFALPSEWSPADDLLGIGGQETDQFALRYSRRFAADEGIAKAGIDDYHVAIYSISDDPPTRMGSVDLQRYFDPPVESEKEFKAHPFLSFVDRAIRFYEKEGITFFESRFQKRRAA